MNTFCMKFLMIVLFLFIAGCKENAGVRGGKTEIDSNWKDNHGAKSFALPGKSYEQLSDSVFIYRYNIQDTIIEDLNCDGVIDYVFFSKKNAVRHLVFSDGKTNQEKVMGVDLPVKGELGETYDWVDFWGITKDSSTWQAIIEDGEIFGSGSIKLNCPSIVLRKEEAGGGVISFKEGGFLWVHQAD